MKKRIPLALMMVLAMLLSACSGSHAPAVTEAPTTEGISYAEEAVPCPLDIENVTFSAPTNSWDFHEVAVKFRNNTQDVITNFIFIIDYLDENGDILDAKYASSESLLESGQAVTVTWTFYDGVPDSIRIASGTYSAASVSYQEFAFDVPLTAKCEFDSQEPQAETSSAEPAQAEHTHDWVAGYFNEHGVLCYGCTGCGLIEEETDSWTPLTSCKHMSDSNSDNGGSKESDIMIGDWEGVSGATYPDALKFWVMDKDGYSSIEFIKYNLEGKYNTLSGIILPEARSDEDATMQIRVYLDDVLEYESQTLTYSTEGGAFYLDVSGVNVVRIECITYDEASAHCIVSASVY